MPSEPPGPRSGWSDCTWDGARLATLLAGARMTMVEKLAWLEEATRATEHLHQQALRRLRRRPPR